ncbi:MAG: transcriptional repressor LexA [Deltaproteobacteria bacterium]|nr:transcriptional repressor LexA [Deltaproteobacteria bacterium]
MKLTDKQQAVLFYIANYIDEWRKPPSFTEICEHFGFRSYNTVTTYLRILEKKGYIRLPSRKNQKRGIQVVSPVEVKRFELPLLGLVAAGKPIEAVENPEVIEIPPSMLGEGDHFVLRVQGDSMRDDGILDGDFVVVRKGPTAENGQTVVAMINNEVTIKKYFKTGSYIKLQPANPDVKPIIVENGNFEIEGRVVGVIRRYK